MPSPKRNSPDPLLAEFGQRVRTQRNNLGLSQEAAAVACGVHWTYLSQVERGLRSPRLENLLKLAHGLGTTPGALANGLHTHADPQ